MKPVVETCPSDTHYCYNFAIKASDYIKCGGNEYGGDENGGFCTYRQGCLKPEEDFCGNKRGIIKMLSDLGELLGDDRMKKEFDEKFDDRHDNHFGEEFQNLFDVSCCQGDLCNGCQGNVCNGTQGNQFNGSGSLKQNFLLFVFIWVFLMLVF